MTTTPVAGATGPDLKFEEREPYEKGFAEYFEREVKPALVVVEGTRTKDHGAYRARMKKAVLISLVITALLALMFLPGVFAGSMPMILKLFITGIVSFMIFVFCAIVAILLLAWASKPAVEFRSASKAALIPPILKFFDPSFKYEENRAVDLETVRKSRLIPFGRGADVRGLDYFQGSYRGVEVILNHLSVFEKDDEGEESKVFWGLLVSLETPRKFSGTTLLLKDYGRLSDWIKLPGLEKVELEDPRFEGVFEVHSTDQTEARYLLPPDIMECLVKLSELNDRATVQCSFVDGRMYITIPTRKTYFGSPQVWKALDTEEIHAFLREIHQVLSIVDLLKLDH